MEQVRTLAQENAEDIFFGQVVLIWARWFFILAGIVLTLWTATSTNEITFSVLFVVALMAMNFFLHGRHLIEKPANAKLILVAAILDLLIITAIVATWGIRIGLQSQFFIFYYPMLLGFAFVFPRRATVLYTTVTLIAYAAICIVVSPEILGSMGDIKLLIMRLITLAAIGGLGTYYWRIQRERRRMTRNQDVTGFRNPVTS